MTSKESRAVRRGAAGKVPKLFFLKALATRCQPTLHQEYPDLRPEEPEAGLGTDADRKIDREKFAGEDSK